MSEAANDFEGGAVETRERQQLEIFGAGAELLDAARGVFSGERVDKHKDKLDAICSALAEGIGVNRTARAFGCSIHTVMGIRERHPEIIAQEERLLSRRLARIQAIGWERYEEALIDGTISPAQLPVGLGIAADKKALLDGRPTAIVEHREREVSIEALNELIQKLPAAVITSRSDSESDGGGENA